MADSRLRVLAKASPVEMHEAHKRYKNTAVTLEDALGRLAKVVDSGSEGQQGQWVEPLKKTAGEIQAKLKKAAVRYKDVAAGMATYIPHVETAQHDVRVALSDEEGATSAGQRAGAMPDPQPGPDGVIPPEEAQKGADKEKAKADAATALAAAKAKLTGTLDALDVAGKAFGDSVNCKKYDDGLSDTTGDKINAILKKISLIFQILALVLAVVSLLIPGLNAVALAALVAGAASLAIDATLYARGAGSLEKVILGAIGLGLGGIALGIQRLAINMGNTLTAARSLTFGHGGGAIRLTPLGNVPVVLGSSAGKAPGWLRYDWEHFVHGIHPLFKGDFLKFGQNWWFNIIGREKLGYLHGFKTLTTPGEKALFYSFWASTYGWKAGGVGVYSSNLHKTPL